MFKHHHALCGMTQTARLEMFL